MMTQLKFSDLTESIPDGELPWLDRESTSLDDIALFRPEGVESWRNSGYVVLQNFIPHDLIDAYCRLREPIGPQGWPAGTPYMKHDEIKDICCYKPLSDILDYLIGEPMALNLNLTGWVSTERDWHQDIYLSPLYIKSYYLACWFALDTIGPECGPFEYVPGSHKWPTLSREKVFQHIDKETQSNPDWPWITQPWVSAAMEEERHRQKLPTRQFIAEKGDVLIWHSRLMHRGSSPATPGTLRKSLIAHYSGIPHRKDMPNWAQYKDQGRYFVL